MHTLRYQHHFEEGLRGYLDIIPNLFCVKWIAGKVIVFNGQTNWTNSILQFLSCRSSVFCKLDKNNLILKWERAILLSAIAVV